MRLTSLYLLPTTIVAAFQLPNFESFLSALPISIDDYIRPNTTDPPPHDLLKRQFSNTCPTDFHACNNLGAPGLCCASAAVCSPDANGNVACCPIGAECSGTINGVITAGTVNSDGSLIHGPSATGTSSFVRAGSGTTTGLVPASIESTASTQQSGSGTATRTGGGFIVDGTSTVASPGAGVRRFDVVSAFVTCERLEVEANVWAAIVCKSCHESVGISADSIISSSRCTGRDVALGVSAGRIVSNCTAKEHDHSLRK
jgi:hypothetical protein